VSPFASIVGVTLVYYLAPPILVFLIRCAALLSSALQASKQASKRSFSVRCSASQASKRNFSCHRKSFIASKNYSDYSSNFVSRLLNIFNKRDNEEFISNKDSQNRMESIIMDEFNELFNSNQNKYISGGINTEYLTPFLNKYIIGKQKDVLFHIYNLVNMNNRSLDKFTENSKIKKVLHASVVTEIDKQFLRNLCFTHFLLVYTYQNTESTKNHLLIPVPTSIAKMMFNKYLNILRYNYCKVNNEENLSFSA